MYEAGSDTSAIVVFVLFQTAFIAVGAVYLIRYARDRHRAAKAKRSLDRADKNG